jgi:ATP-dependent Clp protease ATP-binding subunit ClpC
MAIEACGVDAAGLQAAVVARLAPASARPKGHIPFTQEGKKSLELAARSSLLLGHDRIGTEHLLLGLIAEGTGLAAQVLGESGVTAEGAQEEVLRLAGN